MSKMVGLKIMLAGGHFLQVAVVETDARSLVAAWVKGELPPILSHADVKTPTGSSHDWAVKSTEIVAMHSFDMDEKQGNGGKQPPGRGGSGLNW